jgi:hypothetical protein
MKKIIKKSDIMFIKFNISWIVLCLSAIFAAFFSFKVLMLILIILFLITLFNCVYQITKETDKIQEIRKQTLIELL